MNRQVLLYAAVLMLALGMIFPTDGHAIKYELVQFDPNFQPPPGVFSGGRPQATGMILSHIRSNFDFAGTTIQVVTSVGATGAGDQVNTIRYIPSNSTGYISGRLGRPYTSACWGCQFRSRPGTGFVFGSEFNADPAMNNSSAYARAAGATGAHEAGHGLNASHTTGGSDKMKKGSTGTEKAATDRDFTTGNQARMLSAVRAGTAAPAGGGKERITCVFSHNETSWDPTIKWEDPFTMVLDYLIDTPDWQLGFINHVGEFILIGGEMSGLAQIRGGGDYEFAVRSVLDPLMVCPISTYGASLVAGPLNNPEDAVVPLVDEPYFGQLLMDFMTPMGAVHVELFAEGKNGFLKPPPGEIPTLQHWGMILLLLILMGFAVYRIRIKASRVRA
ncbi:MAG: hypothetical protein ABIA59_03140 [Candidatus Latescibacterota bacterium]